MRRVTALSVELAMRFTQLTCGLLAFYVIFMRP